MNLYHGDCLDILPTLAPQSVDAVICDPPYGTTACKWDSVIPFEPMWRELKRIIKPRGAIVLFGSQPFTSVLVMSNPKWYRHEWVWEKDRAANILNANRMPLDVAENVLVFSEGIPTYIPQMVPCKPYRHKHRRIVTENFGGNAEGYDPEGYSEYTHAHPRNVVYFARESGLHPTQKPVALMEYLIRTYTNEGDTVLDFTMGSGTTGAACVNTGRDFIGIEQDEGYYTKACERIEAAQQAMVQMELLA